MGGCKLLTLLRSGWAAGEAEVESGATFAADSFVQETAGNEVARESTLSESASWVTFTFVLLAEGESGDPVAMWDMGAYIYTEA